MIYYPKFLTKLRDIPVPLASKFLKRNAANDDFEWADAGGGSPLQHMHIRDEKASGSFGGAAAGGNQVRALNTVVTNTITGASLSSNRITLPAGIYSIHAYSPGRGTQSSRLYFYNYSDSTIAINGVSAKMENTDGLRTEFMGRVDITTEKTFEVKQWNQQSFDGGGIGYGYVTAGQSGINEVFTEVLITKVG